MKSFRNLLYVTMTLFCVSIVLVGCGNNKSSHSDKIRIVTSTDIYGQAARAVAGSKAQVNSIINNPNVDPHDYQPTIKVAENISNANVVIYNGLGYDSWIEPLTQNTKKHTKLLNVGANLLNKKTGDNPHVWYFSKTMIKLTNEIAKTLSNKDPANKTYYFHNARKYINTFSPIQHKIKQLKSNKSKILVDVSEPVFDYSLKEMGYQVKDGGYSKAVENGTDPTPNEIRSVQLDIIHHKIAFFVENTQASDSIVDNLVQLAKKHKVPVVKVTETMPNNTTYQKWMLSQYQQVERIQNERK
ncbi:metal ABC transporter solute-binding protein, Zn/Mn family [Apilactobacillus timberlakei]|uniref:metal ABC transporter solute-binding protein, Zn/Mn family n=1 Tax=Apilactobacillus timberlakei TaxID=2008380 RepID=UPI001CDD170A|nr:zinc ABC transporter substrate-binding protein [Apilactobacillus timberlakei]